MNGKSKKSNFKSAIFREERSKDIFEIDNTFYHSKEKSLQLAAVAELQSNRSTYREVYALVPILVCDLATFSWLFVSFHRKT